MPDVCQTTLFLFESSGVLCSELQTPETNSFVGNHDATFCQQVLNIPKAESEAMVKPHRVTDDFGREAVAFVAGFPSFIVADPADGTST